MTLNDLLYNVPPTAANVDARIEYLPGQAMISVTNGIIELVGSGNGQILNSTGFDMYYDGTLVWSSPSLTIWNNQTYTWDPTLVGTLLNGWDGVILPNGGPNPIYTFTFVVWR